MDIAKLFNFLEEQEVSPNQYYLLWSIKNRHLPKHINNMLEKRQLVNRDLIDEKFNINEKGLQILDLIATQVNTVNSGNKLFVVDEYINIFPRIKLPSGKPARVNKKTVTECLNWFFKNYDYDWSTVLKATALYVDEYESKNYMYMRTSQYFIRKSNTDKTWESELANYCDMVLNGLDNDAGHFSETVV